MRNKRLDILRCIAVVLVIVYHGNISAIVAKIGWVGVDLFFVLSGFLISGLFYSEYKKRSSISFRRFFVRRGFKIYPSFYVFLLVTFLAQIVLSHHSGWGPYLREIFFIQNYKDAIWAHTWSLAVEEHFYILLPILLWLLIRFSRDKSNPFRIIPACFVAVAMACLSLRFAVIHFTSPASFRWQMVWTPTHDRLDALLLGVALGYFHHYHPEIISNFMSRPASRIALGLSTLLLLSLCFFYPHESHFLLTFGLILVDLGCGGLLILCLYTNNILPSVLARPVEKIGTVFAIVGTYSYSIYLWHAGFAAWAPGVVRRVLHIQFTRVELFYFYFAGSIAFGVLMARLIEFPTLRLRDRLFPAMQTQGGPVPAETGQPAGRPRMENTAAAS